MKDVVKSGDEASPGQHVMIPVSVTVDYKPHGQQLMDMAGRKSLTWHGTDSKLPTLLHPQRRNLLTTFRDFLRSVCVAKIKCMELSSLDVA